jgi:hypothetical protein
MSAITVLGLPTARSQASGALTSAPGSAPVKPSMPAPVFRRPHSSLKSGSFGIEFGAL